MVSLIIGLFLFTGYAVNAQNIKGIIPVQEPTNGSGVDGDAWAHEPIGTNFEPVGDLFDRLFFLSGQPIPGSNPPAFYPVHSINHGLIDPATGNVLYKPSPVTDPPTPQSIPVTYQIKDRYQNDLTIFTLSNKINDNPNTYTWGPGNSPNKNEIQNCGAHFSYGDPNMVGGVTDASGNFIGASVAGDPKDLWCLFAGDRQVTNGSSYIDFEFLQAPLTITGATYGPIDPLTGVAAIESGSGAFHSEAPDETGGRTPGDILVTIEFTQGGGDATVVIQQWTLVGGVYQYQVVGNNAFPNQIFCTNNNVTTTVPFDVYGANPGTYVPNQWAEGAINLTKVLTYLNNPCTSISTLFIRTRSSGNSSQSELKDFPGAPIQLNLDFRPDLPTVDGDAICGPGVVDLSASGCEDGTLKWFDAAVDGNQVATGETYSPNVTQTTSFWVSCTRNGCEGPRAEVIATVNPLPEADAGDDDSVCYDGGTNTMQLDGSASGGTSPYSYAWSGDITYLSATNIANPTHNNAPVGTYNLTLTVTDDSGCQDTDTVQLVVDPNPTADAGDDDSVCYDGGTNTMQLDGSASGGTSPYSYAWSGDTTYLSATNIANPTHNNAAVGTYNLTLTVTDANGCQDTDTVQLVVDPNPTADAGDDDSVCYDGGTNTMQLDGSASGGTSPYSYAWSGDTSYLSATNIANPTYDNAPVGTYNLTLTVTDTNGCQDTDTVQLVVDPNPTADAGDDDSVCYDGGTNTMQLDGSASGGTSPYSYAWSGDTTYLSATNIANPTHNNAPVGTYNLTLTVTDANGCQDTDTVQLVVDPNPTADAGDDDSVCYDGGTNTMQLDGSASGGTSPYSYAWSGDTTYLSATNIANPTHNNAPVGTYNLTLTVTDANGCQDTDTVQLVVDTNPTADAGDDDSVCYDGGTNTMQLDGSASGGTSPYSYAWSGDTTYLSATNIANPTHNNAPVGTYNLTLTVTDDSGCQDTDTVQLVVDPNPTADAGDDDSVCYDGGTNTMQLDGSASGGTSPYSYAWSGDTSYLSATNIANPTHNNAPVGTYNLTLTVTDANGCQDTDTVQLVVDPNPTADAGDDDSVCYDGGTNTIQLDGSASGGTSPYSYAWSGDTTYLSATNIANPTHNNAPAGTYNLTLTVTDANGCQDTDTVQLVVNPNPECSITGEQTICSGSSSIFTATAGMASYSWTGPVGFTPATTQSITVSIAGIYEVTITDANGCSSKCTRELIVENCGYGCTPGFWQGGKGKQLWDGVGKDPVGDKVGFTTNTSFYDVFTGVTPGSCDIPSSLTMIDAITLGGGNCRKLVRHGVAGVLNAATLEGYPLPNGITTIQGLIDAIEAAINNSCGCEELASEIAANNELNHDLCGTISEDALDLLISNVSTSKPIDAKSSDTSFDAYPVPFKDQLTIKYKFDYTSDVKIEVFNIQGILVFSTTDNNSYLNKEVLLNLAIPREQEQLYVVKLTTDRGSSIKKILSSVKN
ncbi:PKD domain-containing protein [Flavobacterium maritimum]|uniref:PKD domain-containing protein n=1 Tax=Flavobacterium maritimum TaxID=3149042 RepID=UPI0032B51006